MTQLVRAFGDYLPVWIAGFTVLAAAGAVATWFRVRRGTDRWAAVARSALDVLILGACLGIVLVTLTPSASTVHRRLDLVPFRSLWRTLTNSVDASVSLAQIAGNVALFVPLGLLLPLRFQGMRRLTRLLVVVGAAAVLIEALQFVLGTGRVSSIDDVILALAGAFVGHLAGALLLRRAHPETLGRRQVGYLPAGK